MFVISGKHFQIIPRIYDHYSFGIHIFCTFNFLLRCYFLPEIVVWKKDLYWIILKGMHHGVVFLSHIFNIFSYLWDPVGCCLPLCWFVMLNLNSFDRFWGWKHLCMECSKWQRSMISYILSFFIDIFFAHFCLDCNLITVNIFFLQSG